MKRSVRQDLNLERENDVGVFMFRKRVAGNVCARRNSDSSDMRRVLFTEPVLSSKHSSADIITANHRSEAPIKKEKIMWQLPSLSSNCHLEQPSDLFFIKLCLSGTFLNLSLWSGQLSWKSSEVFDTNTAAGVKHTTGCLRLSQRAAATKTRVQVWFLWPQQ